MLKKYNKNKIVSHIIFDKSKQIILFKFMGNVFLFKTNISKFKYSKRITKNMFLLFSFHRILKRLGL
tara:strand:+ start:72 stop:272 length:201 start_codon:yes stop_codon:yes gene_type:complete